MLSQLTLMYESCGEVLSKDAAYMSYSKLQIENGTEIWPYMQMNCDSQMLVRSVCFRS